MAPVVAHEVSQPLTAIAAYAGACARLLRAGDPDSVAKALHAVEGIAAEAQRGCEIIRRMRSVLAGPGLGRERVELSGLFDWIERKASVEAEAVGSVFVREPAPPIAIAADAVLVQQVLLNLIHNALDAVRSGRRGAGVVSVRAYTRADGFAELAVCDDGGGVSEGIGERMFDLAVTTKPQGGGIGLAFCRSIVEAHGGRLWAETNPALGTTFKLTLPVATER